MTPQPLPVEFVLNHTTLSWREALWGYEHQWIDWNCLSELAAQRVAKGGEKLAEIELAGLTRAESASAGTLVHRLSTEEPVACEESLRKKWLYLILRWLFDKRMELRDPFAAVEDIFCDFEHPLEIAGFVRFMPAPPGYDPREHTTSENEARMMEQWQGYLSSAESIYGVKG